MNKLDKYNRLKQVKEIIPRLDFLELVAVLFADKPVMAQTNIGDYDEQFKDKLDQLYKILNDVGLQLAVSDFKIIANSAKSLFKPVPLDDYRAGSVVVGVSKDLDKALQAVAYVKWKTKSDDYSRKFGELMGYPECCLDFGDSLSGKTEEENSFSWENPALETLKRSDNFKWQLNVFSVDPIVPHSPCSLDCEKSVDYVNSIVEILEKYDPKLARKRKDILKEPISLFWHSMDKVLLYGDYSRDKDNFLSAKASYQKATPYIQANSYYHEGDDNRAEKLKEIAGTVEKGDELKVSRNSLKILKDGVVISQIKKDNPYLPILIAPDCKNQDY